MYYLRLLFYIIKLIVFIAITGTVFITKIALQKKNYKSIKYKAEALTWILIGNTLFYWYNAPLEMKALRMKYSNELKKMILPIFFLILRFKLISLRYYTQFECKYT